VESHEEVPNPTRHEIAITRDSDQDLDENVAGCSADDCDADLAHALENAGSMIFMIPIPPTRKANAGNESAAETGHVNESFNLVSPSS